MKSKYYVIIAAILVVVFGLMWLLVAGQAPVSNAKNDPPAEPTDSELAALNDTPQSNLNFLSEMQKTQIETTEALQLELSALKDQLQKDTSNEQQISMIEKLNDEITALKSKQETQKRDIPTASKPVTSGSSKDSDGILSELEAFSNSTVAPPSVSKALPEKVTIRSKTLSSSSSPLSDAVTPNNTKTESITGGILNSVKKLEKGFTASNNRFLNHGSTLNLSNDVKETATLSQPSTETVKKYTINNVATLVDNTTMTAMLGTVPTSEGYKRIYRIKVVTDGKTNLAASRHRLPDNIKDIVWTGFAYGNRDLSCVEAYLDTVNLIFEDGTIAEQTVRSGSTSVGAGSGDQKYLAYLTDQWGKPCIAGELYSNATDYLRDRTFLSAIEGLGEAAAALEQTSIRNTSEGTTESFVSGDTKNFILGKLLAGGVSEGVNYSRERMANAIDVVYIPTGKEVSIHVEHTIEFDYNPAGRKLNHDNEFVNVHHFE